VRIFNFYFEANGRRGRPQPVQERGKTVSRRCMEEKKEMVPIRITGKPTLVLRKL
jgi:hypothetical protein